MRFTKRGFYAAMVFAIALGGTAVMLGCGGGSASGGGGGTNPCNPCGANPCGANPCGAGANPCGANPCNPCGGNPCGAKAAGIDGAKVKTPDGWSANTGGLDDAALLAKGTALWNDKSLSKSKAMACQTCHATPAMYKPSFATPYPHMVEMPKQKAGVDSVSAVEMVQFCMMAPMQTEPLAWDSVELAALARAVEEKNKEFIASKK